MEFDNPDILTNYYRGDGWMINRKSRNRKSFSEGICFMYGLFDRNDFPVDQVCKVYFTCDDHEKLVALETKIRVRFGNKK